jgi:hypothetical protein
LSDVEARITSMLIFMAFEGGTCEDCGRAAPRPHAGGCEVQLFMDALGIRSTSRARPRKKPLDTPGRRRVRSAANDRT